MQNIQNKLYGGAGDLRRCPICDNLDAKLLHRNYFAEKAMGILPKEYLIMQCLKCGFIYDRMDADEDKFAEYYKNTDKYTTTTTGGSGGYSGLDQIRFGKNVDFIQKNYSGNNHAILDFGCGRGGLLKSFYDRGYRNLTAYDNSLECLEYIRREYGFHVVENKKQLLNMQFDLIVCSQVFEHLYSISNTLSCLRKLLRENGMIYIDVPDASRYDTCFVSPYHYFDVEHINHFSVDFLKMLLNNFGFNFLGYEQFDIEPVAGILYPGIRCCARKVEYLENSNIYYSEELSAPISRYLDISAKTARQKKLLLEQIHGPVCIWGIGAYAMRMLQNGFFSDMNVVALIDKSEKMQHQTVQKFQIQPPDFLKGRSDLTVIITSVLYNEQIKEELRQSGFAGDIFSLV